MAGACLLSAVAALALGACGESKQDKAKNTVCSARSDIETKVKHLATITPSSSAVSEIKSDVSGIASDLEKIKNAQGDLAPSRKQEVEKATDEFANKAGSIISNAIKSGSTANLTSELQTALKSLRAAYSQTLAPVNCS